MNSNFTVGVLTSGGDAPGMNPAIRSVVRGVLSEGHKVKGIYRGYQGMINNEIFDMELRSVSDIIQRGGTMLYTARSMEFMTTEGRDKAYANLKAAEIDALVVIGGDGSFKGALEISKYGIPVVGIPGTIDNDISCSEYTIGFDTAMNTVVELVDKLRDTAQSHERCTVVEVMGRHCGNIALTAGVATGATSILVPEIKFDYEMDIYERIEATRRSGKKHFIVVIAEGVYGPGMPEQSSEAIAARIQKDFGIDTRATILGHVQRGGSPSARDRIVAGEMGFLASKLICNDSGNRVILMRDGVVCDMDMEEALRSKKTFDFELYRMAYDINR